jgi:hypothetical protein
VSTPASFEVDLGQIRQHANKVGEIAGSLGDAANGLPDGLAGNPLGTFVQFLTAGLADAMTKTKGAIGQVATMTSNVSAGLSQAADHYQTTDEHSAARLNGVR